MELNEEQRAVVAVERGIWQVVAGPGSGKTATLVERSVRLYGENDVPPEELLVLTFTSSAARNLRDRVEDRIFTQPPGRIAGFMTFHAWALAFLEKEKHNIDSVHLTDNFLATEGQLNKIGYELANKFNLNWRALRSYISLQKRNRTTSPDALAAAEKRGEGQSEALAYKQYDKRLSEAGILDFDSLMLEAVKALENNEGLRNVYQYAHIMVDEAQDCDRVQYRLLQLLTEKYGNILLVGDANQSVYQWRGADTSLFTGIEQIFPDIRKLYLGTNYRSTKKLVEFIKKIAPNRDELLDRFNTPNEEGTEPEIRVYSTPEREAEEIAKIIAEDPEHSAILARTNLALRSCEEALIDANVKYHLLGKSGFWTCQEVKNVVPWLQCCVGFTTPSILGAIRAPFWPSRFIKKKLLIEEIEKYTKSNDCDGEQSAYQVITGSSDKNVREFASFLRKLVVYRHLPAKDAVAAILKDLKAAEYYKEEESIESDNNPVENLKELVKAAGKHETLRDFLNFIRKVQAASKSRKGAAVGTGHAAKGLEFGTVCLIQCTEGILPHKRSTDLLEEANIFFVMASRTERRLVISYSGQKSRFLEELNENKRQNDGAGS